MSKKMTNACGIVCVIFLFVLAGLIAWKIVGPHIGNGTEWWISLFNFIADRELKNSFPSFLF